MTTTKLLLILPLLFMVALVTLLFTNLDSTPQPVNCSPYATTYAAMC